MAGPAEGGAQRAVHAARRLLLGRVRAGAARDGRVRDPARHSGPHPRLPAELRQQGLLPGRRAAGDARAAGHARARALRRDAQRRLLRGAGGALHHGARARAARAAAAAARARAAAAAARRRRRQPPARQAGGRRRALAAPARTDPHTNNSFIDSIAIMS